MKKKNKKAYHHNTYLTSKAFLDPLYSSNMDGLIFLYARE
ncbi:hypothetical protein I656_00698 [Geobacillus sp. WSUCF1]|nr:hypothetical protein I656_00698 [Geobacillus sp. WSUCF1]